MKITASLAGALVIAAVTPAFAQDVLVEGPGVKVSESTVLHPTAGIEGGVVSNVFFEDKDTTLSPIIRILAGLDISPAGKDRIGTFDARVARKVEFRAGVGMEYTEYLAEEARDQRNLDLIAQAHAKFNPQGNGAFALTDKFQRIGRPENFESGGSLDRDVNHFKAEALYQPQRRNISAGLRYENTIDIFEAENSDYPDRMQHVVGARAKWKFFPYTQAWFDTSLGFYGTLGDNTRAGQEYKIGSNPLRVLLGFDTVLTQATTVKAFAGYANGFYSSGPSFNIVVGGVDFGWRYQPHGRLVLGYSYDVNDSINANFYGEHHVRAGLNHQFNKIVATAGVGARVRGYRGVSPLISAEGNRDDFILETNFRLAWMIQDRFSAYADYSLQSVNTDFRSGTGTEQDDPSFVRQEALVGVTAAF